MKYGLIDSGLGGYAFLKGIHNKNDSYILIMDNAFFPYGNKTKNFLIKRTIYLVDYLKNYKKVDKVILACNTLSLLVLPFLKKIYKDDIMGVFELLPKNKDNGIYIASKNSCSEYIGNSYDASDLIYKIQNNHDVTKDIFDICQKFKNYDLLILGCTHFILVKDEFKKYHRIISQDELFFKNTK